MGKPIGYGHTAFIIMDRVCYLSNTGCTVCPMKALLRCAFGTILLSIGNNHQINTLITWFRIVNIFFRFRCFQRLFILEQYGNCGIDTRIVHTGHFKPGCSRFFRNNSCCMERLKSSNIRSQIFPNHSLIRSIRRCDHNVIITWSLSFHNPDVLIKSSVPITDRRFGRTFHPDTGRMHDCCGYINCRTHRTVCVHIISDASCGPPGSKFCCYIIHFG